MKDDPHRHPFRRSGEDRESACHIRDTPQTRTPSYALAFADPDFMLRDELRPVRLQLELLKPELLMNEAKVQSTIVMFGGARIPAPENKDQARTKTLTDLSKYYEEARKLARIVTTEGLKSDALENVIVTGGGPGVMEAGNRGAQDAGGKSIGLNIVLPTNRPPMNTSRLNCVSTFTTSPFARCIS